MSAFLTPPGGTPTPAPPVNANTTFETIGIAGNGALTTVTTGAANTKGSYAYIGSTTNAWSGFFLNVGGAGVATLRFLMDVRIGGTTIILPDFYIRPGVAAATPLFIPLAIPASTLIEVRAQASAGTQSLPVALVGMVANSTTPPGFTQATALNADTANTFPSAPNIALQNSGPSWTQEVASTSGTYGAIYATADFNGTNLATAQDIAVDLATGSDASEVKFAEFVVRASAGTAGIQRAAAYFPIQIASGTRLTVGALAPTPGTDNIRVGLYGFF